jgi:phosphohistidine swiveling domain-containing protein
MKIPIPKDKHIYSGIFVPLLNSYPIYGGAKILSDTLPGFGFDPIISICCNEGEEGYWVQDDAMVIHGYKLLFKSPMLIKKTYHFWREKEAIFYKVIDQLTLHGIRKLERDFRIFNKAYVEEYGVALLVDYFYLGSEYVYGKSIKKYPKLKGLIDLAIKPQRVTFTQKNELSLLRIALIKDKKQQAAAIEKHQQEFFWLHNNYKYTKKLSVAYFRRQINVFLKLPINEVHQRIEEIVNYDKKQYNLFTKLKAQVDKETFSNLFWVSKVGLWHDCRKRANLVADYWVNEFAKRASKKLNIAFDRIQFTTFQELQKLLTGEKLKLNLKQRMSGCIYLCSPSGQELFATGKEFKKSKKQLLEQKVSKEVKGIGVSLGKVTGKVRVIKSSREKIDKKEILVTSMTRPDFMPLVSKAAAIITDEGGLTCHAAIISRELKIPCIVATKTATKALKTGQLVEVDAFKGIVKVIR